MTNYNERLDEILDFIENYGVSASTEGFDKTDSRAEAKQALLDWQLDPFSCRVSKLLVARGALLELLLNLNKSPHLIK